MKIKVLGPGCPFCKKLHEMTLQALAELGIVAEVEHIHGMKEILRYVPATPGLVINEKGKHYGKPLPSLEKVKGLIQEEGGLSRDA